MFKKSFIILLATTLLAGNVLAADELPPLVDNSATDTSLTTTAETSDESTAVDTSTTTSGTTATSTVKTVTKGFEDFNDVSVNHPYYNAIIVLRYQGVLSGYSDNTFHPDQPLNRVEALKLVFEVADLDFNTGIASAKFSDTEANTWYTSYLNRAAFLEIVSGYPDGSFRPSQSVNLVEFLKMLELAQKVDLSKSTLAQIPYADVMPGQWYSKYVNFAKINNLLDTDEQNNIHPDQALTRGRAAEIIYRFRNMLSKPSTPAEENPDTGSQPPVSDQFGIYVSESYKFAVQYPRNWFYSSIENTNQTAIRTYGFGPKDLTENAPSITLELLPADENFQPNLDYQGFMYKKSASDDGTNNLQLSAKINGSTRIYRIAGPIALESTMLTMLTSLTANIEGLETTTYSTTPAASDTTSTTSDTTTSDSGTTTDTTPTT
ncbi:S-layer homology domain-containing protein [Candidatus Peregrinibacteria bacterium]|nr:S-layer homology domain-containing protein [Candidatus Peregrinibacteria bacterium]